MSSIFTIYLPSHWFTQIVTLLVSSLRVELAQLAVARSQRCASSIAMALWDQTLDQL